MISTNPRGVIELGNINIKCLIYNVENDSTPEILSTSSTPSEGIHNSAIVHLTKASNAIRFCISEAEKKAKVSLKKIAVILEQPEFLCTKFSKQRKIDGSKIDKEDIEFLLKEAKKEVTINDDKQSIIHIFNHNYIVDGKTFVEEPVDVYADFLSHEMTFITMPKNNIKNINQAFIDCDIEVERYISCIFAQAAKLLSVDELRFGSVLIDIGFEKISMGIFKNFALIHSITLPVGVNHITKDISKVCSLSLEESEIIKNKIDLTFQNNTELFDKNDCLKDIYFKESKFRKISRTLICDVVKARLDEIFTSVRKQIGVSGHGSTTVTNFFLIGGGSHLFNFDKFCSNFFGLNVRKFDRNNHKKSEINFDENFISCLGALKIIQDGWETEAIPEPVNKNAEKISFFTKLFGNKV